MGKRVVELMQWVKGGGADAVGKRVVELMQWVKGWWS